MQNHDLTILVVLYGKNVWESQTLKTLISCENLNYRLVIWNNGPKRLEEKNKAWLTENFYNYDVKETIENISLSKLYNKFISEYLAEKYIILDDDSEINSNYLKDAINYIDNGVAIPVIKVKNVEQAPKVNNKYKNSPYQPEERVEAITSGIVLSRAIIDVVSKKYQNVFDERFGFYGVDTSFFWRLKNIKASNQITTIHHLNHSLSRLNEESDSLKKFRSKERSIDVALQIRYYSSSKCYNFLRVIISALLKRNRLSAYYIIKYYMIGHHYK